MRKRTGLTRLGKVTALTGAVVVLAATAAVAHPNSTYVEDGAIDNAKATHGHDAQQHGSTEGHITTENYGLEMVSKLGLSRVTEGKIADVSVFKDTAYLAAWGGVTCKRTGVHVVDIKDVENPKEIGFIPAKEGSYPGEGVQALSISTPAFTGDILVTNNEKCKEPAGFGGMNLYDVTNPAAPQVLNVGFGDDQANNRKQSAHQVHSVFAWQDEKTRKAYAVMVDNEEAEDVDIVDITNPRKPVLVKELDLAALFPQILQENEGLDEVFLHDLVVKKIGDRQVMLLSYWDAGYVQLDMTNPLEPKYLADSNFPNPDTIGEEKELTVTPGGLSVPPEGNAHQAEFTGDNKFVIGADEDFSPFATLAKNTTTDADLDVGSGSGTTALVPGTPVSGPTVFVGLACTAADVPKATATNQVAVIERGVCTFTEKVASAAAQGYATALIFNRQGTDACNASLGMSVEGAIYAFGVAPREQGFDLFGAEYSDAACLAGTEPTTIKIGAEGESVLFNSYFDGWGYVRLLDGKTMEEVDAYAIPEAHDQKFAVGYGDLSVHEVATSKQRDDLAFLSYYAGGVRAITTTDGKITEVGAFIDEGGNNFWGVEVFEQNGVEYAALSDRDFGLYIMKLAPPTAP